MANQKITDLTNAASVALTDILEIVDMTGPTSKKVLLSVLRAALLPIDLASAEVTGILSTAKGGWSASASESLTSKTLVLASNTLTDTSAAQGDLCKHNGTRYVRFAKGSSYQSVRVNASGTDLEFAAVDLGTAAITGTLSETNGGTGATSLAGIASNIETSGTVAARGFVHAGVTSNATSGGTINNCAVSGASIVMFTDAIGPTVTGFNSSGLPVGFVLTVFAAGGSVAVTHEGAGSSASNRCTLNAGITINIPGGCITQFMLLSDGANTRWRHIGATAI